MSAVQIQEATQRQPAHIHLANPRGFCAGVDRAIDIVNRALDIYGAPIYVRHEVVHNKFVVDTLRQRGAIFVDELSDIPAIDSAGRSSIVVFSAHGVAQSVKEEAEQRGFKVFDATCPLVTKVHLEVVGFRGAMEAAGTAWGCTDLRYIYIILLIRPCLNGLSY